MLPMLDVLHRIYDLIIVLIVLYTIRHYVFTLNRLYGKQRHPFVDIDVGKPPSVRWRQRR